MENVGNRADAGIFAGSSGNLWNGLNLSHGDPEQ